MKTKIIPAGGFLGAGKTTLLMKAAEMLAARNIRAGLITNDQAPELVDSALLRHEGLRVDELSGSCFCCNFGGFVEAAMRLRKDEGAEVIIAEAVGSCTDLSATVLQPLKAYAADDFEVAPLTVLADPLRLSRMLDGRSTGFHADADYIYAKQPEEADVILIGKADMYWPAAAIQELSERAAERFPWAEVFVVSSVTGLGMDEWLDCVLSGKAGGTRIAEVDYDRYARGEAVLGWLNATLFLQSDAMDWNRLAQSLMQSLADSFAERDYGIGHLKLIMDDCDGYIAGNLTAADELVDMRGALKAGPRVRLTLNLRAEAEPEALEAAVRDVLRPIEADGCGMEQVAWRCLSPGRPQPTHRFAKVV
ncbi:MAG: cobalamin synthesis protein P47K [Tannerellaceae bacterium]|jgi:G3E family GTPase|nr:cobalamin synthesis protein P47K [Tannerellaceae bacterium]